MKTLTLGTLVLGGILAFGESVAAHGGQYRGPEDVVPPGAGSGGRSTGRGTGPTTGPGAGPRAPGPAGGTNPGGAGSSPRGRPGAGGVGPGRTGPRGMDIGDDFTGWDYWWEFNKDPYLRLKNAVHASGTISGSDDFYLGGNRRAAVHSLKPTQDQIRNEIVPALKRALDDTLERDFDIISSCLVALAKIGTDHRDFRLVDVFEERLDASNQEIRESAAIALGIAGMTSGSDEQMKLLIGLALDNEVGRKASGDREVNERTRSFAAHGLGLAAHSTTNLAIKRRAFETLETLLTAKEQSGFNLRVSAIHGLSLLNLEPGTRLLDEALDALERFYMRRMGAGDQLMQAHCPTAIAKLIGSNHPRAAHFRALFVKDLFRKGPIKRSSRDIQRSCALALGQLGNADDPELSARLLESWHAAKDVQTRYFSVLALGQIGGKQNRDTLLKEFSKGRSLDRPWVALALGVLAFELEEPDQLIGETLYEELKKTNNPDGRAALAVALGLSKHTPAAPKLREMMVGHTAQEQLAGYLCIGLALMDDKVAKHDIRQVIEESTRKPDLLQQAAVALGKLGDKRVVDLLRDLLEQSDNNLAKLAAVSSALGFIGDRSSITPLTQTLNDGSLSQLSRAFAAVALGGVADKEPLPWNSKISVDTNYRASVETLTDGTSGILDIL